MQVVVLAAGRGKRMGALGELRSKAMQPVLGVPIIGWILADLAALGLQDVVLVRAPNDQALAAYLQHPGIPGLQIQQVLQVEPLGMADALAQAVPLVQQDFLLAACDNRLPRLELQAMIRHWQQRPGLAALLGLLEIPAAQVSQSGIVTLRGERVVGIVEKPALQAAPSRTASLPLYCLRPGFLDLLKGIHPSVRGERELQDALQLLIDQPARVEGWFFSQRAALSRPEDLLVLNLQALERHLPALDVRSEQVGPGVQFLPAVLVEAGVLIGAHSRIGPQVYLEAGARVGRWARLSHCVVLRSGVVPDGAVVQQAIIG